MERLSTEVLKILPLIPVPELPKKLCGSSKNAFF